MSKHTIVNACNMPFTGMDTLYKHIRPTVHIHNYLCDLYLQIEKSVPLVNICDKKKCLQGTK